MPTPSYSPTDLGTALVTLIMAVLDVLSGLGLIPGLSDSARNTLVTSLTVLAVAGATAYIANRRVKHQAQAAVATAQVTAVPPVAAPGTPQPFAGGSFTISPAPTTPAKP